MEKLQAIRRRIAEYSMFMLPLLALLALVAFVRYSDFGAHLPAPPRPMTWGLMLDAMLFALAVMGWAMMVHARLKCQIAESESEQKQRYLTTLENINLIAVAVDREGRIEFCNDCLLHTTGWQRDHVLGGNWFKLFVPRKARSQEQTLFRDAIADGRAPAAQTGEIVTRTGEQRLVAWNTTLSFDAFGNIEGLTCIGEDVTERHAFEEQLRKLSRAVEQSPSIVVITNSSGDIEYVNPKFTQITGYTLKEMTGRNPRTLKSGETSPAEYKRLWDTISGGEVWRGEFHNRKKNGELYWESASISPIRNPEGQISHYVAVKEDITERKRLESEVAARNLELLKNRELTVIGRLANMVAHDLRNPLSSIKMSLQILRKQAHSHLGGQSGELVRISMEQVRYMEEILTDLLLYSRPDALKPEWISLDKLMDTTVSALQKQIDDYRASVTMEFQAGLPTIYGDAVKLRQAFSNLIINAIQACETGGNRLPEVVVSAQLTLEQSGAMVRVEIVDNGTGIEPAIARKVFEPFFTTRSKGSGLGLAIVKRIIEQHHGHILLEALPDRGTRAVVALPLGQHTDIAAQAAT